MKNNILLLIVMIFISCSTHRLHSEINIQKLGNPPGTERIDNNLFIDKTDISNLSYREFMFWNSRIYGKNSNEYKTIFPDTNQWSKLDPSYKLLDATYLWHPAYQEYSVMGVSNSQAKLYSKWRSDRVMEWTLVKYGIINMNLNTPKDSIFTIEKYFSGQYYNIEPSPYLLYYPEYFLFDSTANTYNGFKNVCIYKKRK
jgi:hypothetical protein